MLQARAEQRFNTSFETVAAFDDFAEKIHFMGDLVCKVELGGKYMLAYASVKDVARSLPPDEEEATASQPTPTSNNVANGGYGAAASRKRRNAPESENNQQAMTIGPENELPPNHSSRVHSMWI